MLKVMSHIFEQTAVYKLDKMDENNLLAFVKVELKHNMEDFDCKGHRICKDL